MLVEANLDALVGPTHHFGGLGIGNVASHEHAGQVSGPRQAALEGLQKAQLVASLGVPQFLLLPPIRPRMDLLASLGFSSEGDAPEDLLRRLEFARQESPRALSAAFSSAFMWAANAGTFSPATDTLDRRVHFTPANLISSWHRGLEAAERQADLKAVFQQRPEFVAHDPLPSILPLRDEGAANHMRLCDPSGEIGFNVFVYGAEDDPTSTSAFFPRHARAASEAIARRHGLDAERTFFLRQHPDAISAGAFHNDVIASSHQHLLILHERAFLDGQEEIERLERAFRSHVGRPLERRVIADSEFSLSDAVTSYFFNSQIVSPAGEGSRNAPRMAMICPAQCRELPAAHQLIDRLLADDSIPIEDVHYVDLGESMANGGGPACLRLRIPLEGERLRSLCPKLRLNTKSADQLTSIIEQHYPTSVSLDDFVNVDFVQHVWRTVEIMRREMLGAGA